MISRQRIESKIKQKEQEIQGLELSIREAKSYVQALQDMLKLIPKEGDGSGGDKVLRPGSDMAKARDAIRLAGKALHVSEILVAIGKENIKKSRVALAGSLAGYVRKGMIFSKTAPNTFGLMELSGTNGLQSEGGFPPADFGK